MEIKSTVESWLAERIQARPSTSPWVTLCYAQSLDGCLTAQRGTPTALSGPESTALVHRLRTMHSAILVGIGTILSDNPRLTARLAEGPSPQPVILDSTLHTPPGSAVFQHPHPPIIACRAGANSVDADLLRSAGAQIIPLPSDSNGHISLPALLVALSERGISSLMVEGGAAVLTSFLAEGLADALVVTIAPRLLGGQQTILARPARQLSQPQVAHYGEDLVVWGRLA